MLERIKKRRTDRLGDRSPYQDHLRVEQMHGREESISRMVCDALQYGRDPLIRACQRGDLLEGGRLGVVEDRRDRVPEPSLGKQSLKAASSAAFARITVAQGCGVRNIAATPF